MKEIDTESPVVWPAWCYSDLSKHSPITSASLSPSPSSSETGGIDSVSNKFHTRRKSQFTPKQLAVESVNGIQFNTERNNINSLQNHQHSIAIPSLSSSSSLFPSATLSSSSSSSATLSAVIGTLPIVRQSPLALSALGSSAPGSSAAGSSSLVQQLITTTNDNNKMLSDRMLLGFNIIDNNSSNNKTKHCDNNSSYVYLEKVKNETQMDATRDGNELVNNNNNNNNNNHNNNNNLSNNNINNNLDCNNSNNCTNNTSNNNNNNINNNNNNNCVKRERLSPATNGDLQNISRSRSATPSSFRGTPPQATNSNDLGIQNLSTNLLSSMQNRNNDFSTRNYSDFMRSLAAKYNNSNPNNSNASRRKIFESKTSMQKGNNKELASPTNEQKTTISETPNPTVSPFVSSFLSSLPFSPIIDMSSTQALVTLARAAKEAELQNILRSAQKRPSTSSGHGHSPRSSNLTAALQQAAQFIAPSLLYSAQFQTPTHHTPSSLRQHQQHQQPPSPKQSSTTATEKTTITTTASPLDLSSAPQTKRFKSESTSSSDRSPSRESNQLPTALVHKPAAKSPCNLSEPTTTPGSVNAGANLLRSCQSQSAEVNSWTVDEVCNFVASIDICAEYVQNFREQCIDGSGLPLLTEDHLMNSLRMKLGPALKLRSMLVKKLGGPCPCVSCTTQAQQILATQTAVTSSSVASSSSSQISPQQNHHHLLYGGSSCSQNQQQYSTHNNQISANINNINNNNSNSNSNNNCNNNNNNNLSTCNSQLANSSVNRPASTDSGS